VAAVATVVPTVAVASQPSGSVQFSGSNYLTIPSTSNFALGTSYTIEGWFFRQSNSSSGSFTTQIALVGTQNIGVTCTGFFLVYSSGALYFYDGANTAVINYANATTTMALNTWNHIALVRNGSGSNNVTLYLNGTAVATGTSSSTQAAAVSAFIGGDTAGNGGFTGYISNLRIVGGRALYTSAFTPPAQPLPVVAGTALLTCQSQTSVTTDATGLNTITNTGSATAATISPFHN
jgi:hypothetical protein